MQNLNTVEEVIQWAKQPDEETAKFIKDSIELRLSFINFLKMNPPLDAPMEIFYGSDLDTVRENARLRAYFEQCWLSENFGNRERYPVGGPGIVSFAHDLRDAMNAKLEDETSQDKESLTMTRKPNKHIGSSFEYFLEEEGMLEEVNTAVKIDLEVSPTHATETVAKILINPPQSTNHQIFSENDINDVWGETDVSQPYFPDRAYQACILVLEARAERDTWKYRCEQLTVAPNPESDYIDGQIDALEWVSNEAGDEEGYKCGDTLMDIDRRIVQLRKQKEALPK